jgi:hypothetical protein
MPQWPFLAVITRSHINNIVMDYCGLGHILNISNTLRVVAECWVRAEASLLTEIKAVSPDANEEFITKSFHGKFAKALVEASTERCVEEAFLLDLQTAFPDLCFGPELRGLAHGLIANVTLHTRQTEELTGGDIGFMIVRPQISDHIHSLHVRPYRRGLLCQAKLKNPKHAWGRFTDPQMKELCYERLQYLALLLYRYEDEERRILRPFQWQLCNSASSIAHVANWLSKNNFPSLATSSDIINRLGNAQIGTDDDAALDKTVAPAGNTALVIMINWPKDAGPGSQVYVYSARQSLQQLPGITQIET